MIWLLHGNLGSPADWKPVMDALRSNGIESRALNLWKYLECCPKSLPEMGRVLCSEIAAQDKRPYICGYSLGGRLAMHAVLAHSPLWKGAMFISANPGLKNEEEKAARRAADAEWAVKCLSTPWENFLREWDAQAVFGGEAGNPGRSSLKPWRKSISRAFIDWSVGAQENLAPLLKQSLSPAVLGSDANSAPWRGAWRENKLSSSSCRPPVSGNAGKAGGMPATIYSANL
ncbi:MAG: hypothetical protein ACLSUW_03440 [Akkermansia sp.]